MTPDQAGDAMFCIPENMQTRLERAQAALEFVADAVGDVEFLRGALGKANGTASPAQTRHAEVHAGGMAAFCHLISDELAAVLQSTSFAVGEERDDE